MLQISRRHSRVWGEPSTWHRTYYTFPLQPSSLASARMGRCDRFCGLIDRRNQIEKKPDHLLSVNLASIISGSAMQTTPSFALCVILLHCILVNSKKPLIIFCTLPPPQIQFDFSFKGRGACLTTGLVPSVTRVIEDGVTECKLEENCLYTKTTRSFCCSGFAKLQAFKSK